MKKKGSTNTLIVIIAIVILGLAFWIMESNRLNNAHQDVDFQWSQVENVMQRRADLIPNVVSAVKGSMKHETKIFTEIAKARQSYNDAQSSNAKLKADSRINKSVGTMINAIYENYPKLKSNENVKRLIEELEGTENRITVERRRYIQSVRTYNELVRNFPSSIVASSKGLTTIDYYKAGPDAYKVPKVDLNE